MKEIKENTEIKEKFDIVKSKKVTPESKVYKTCDRLKPKINSNSNNSNNSNQPEKGHITKKFPLVSK